MSRREKQLCVWAGVLLVLSMLFLGPIPGVRFSGYLLCAATVALLLTIPLNRWAKWSSLGRLVKRGLSICMILGLALFLAVEAVLLSWGEKEPPEEPVCAVIVLGAGVNGEQPSLILQSRIDAAAAYLKEHPDVPAVLSGGQGPGEDITEATAMHRELLEQGIPSEQLLLEEESTSTAENFLYSKALLDACGVQTGRSAVAVVTSDFHCFRSHLIARRANLSTVSIPAEAPWPWLNANYYIREFFALGKTLVFD